ncbi:MAG: SOS response-associated peptidase [Halobacteriaceae archaeon]
MCGRTSLFAPVADLEERFGATPDYDYRPRYNVAPGSPLATIDAERPDAIRQRVWGLVAPWADDPDEGPRPINARAETVSGKRFFADAFAERRCLVVVDGYYEWRERRGQNQPYRVHLPGDAPFALAGLWRRWEGESRDLDTVTVVTCEAAPPVADVHDRMPVLLSREAESTWLDGPADAAADCLEPWTDELRAEPVSTLVNDPGNDSPAVLEPVEPPEQTDLDSFGG